MACAIQQLWLVLLSHQKVVITQTAVLGMFFCKATFISHLNFKNPDTHIGSQATSFPLMRNAWIHLHEVMGTWSCGSGQAILGDSACQWHIPLLAEQCHGLQITEPWVWITGSFRSVETSASLLLLNLGSARSSKPSTLSRPGRSGQSVGLEASNQFSTNSSYIKNAASLSSGKGFV